MRITALLNWLVSIIKHCIGDQLLINKKQRIKEIMLNEKMSIGSLNSYMKMKENFR